MAFVKPRLEAVLAWTLRVRAIVSVLDDALALALDQTAGQRHSLVRNPRPAQDALAAVRVESKHDAALLVVARHERRFAWDVQMGTGRRGDAVAVVNLAVAGALVQLRDFQVQLQLHVIRAGILMRFAGR